MNTKNLLLLGVLLVQLVIVGFVYQADQHKSAPEISFFQQLKKENIVGLTITDDEKKTLNLRLKDGKWFVGQESIPANDDSLQSIVAKLVNLKSSRLVSRTKSSHVRLKVTDDIFNRKIVLSSQDDTQTTFYLGTSANHKSIHFRKDDDTNVYLVKDLASWELQPEKDSWWKSEFINFNAQDLTGLLIHNPQGEIILNKNEDKWLSDTKSQDGLIFSDEQAEKLVNSLTKISLSEYLGQQKPQDLAEPVTRIEYTTKESTVKLNIWSQNEEDQSHIAKLSNQPFYVKIRNYAIKDILEATEANLFQEEKGKDASDDPSTVPPENGES